MAIKHIAYDTATETPTPGQIWIVSSAGIAEAVDSSNVGVTDHGSLSGLGDDDHTQYALADGTRGDFAQIGHNHDADYADITHTHTEADITDLQHFTIADANSAIDNRVDKTFVDALNVDADTLDGQHASAFATSGHNHNTIYYTETEVDNLLDDKVNTSAVGSAGGVASLDGSGKVPTTQLPALAITEVHVVADTTARDALTVQEGDVAIVTGDSTYIYDGTAWQEMSEGADHTHDIYLTEAEADVLYADISHNHAASNITSGTFANARISQSSVTQHQAALTITESQISDLDHFTTADANSAIDARVDKSFVDALNVDADTLDGQHASAFAASGHNHDSTYVNVNGDTMTGDLEFATTSDGVIMKSGNGTRFRVTIDNTGNLTSTVLP